MEVTIKNIQGLAFAGMGETKHWLMMDNTEEFGGSGGATKPMELLLMSLGGCTGMDVVSILRKMRVDLDDFSIDIKANQAEDYPKVFTKIDLMYRFYGKDIDVEKVEKAIALSQDKYCSIMAMLKKAIAINYSYEIHPSKVKNN
jgi:putative redox protein